MIPTQTQVTGAAWSDVSILDTDGSTVPMSGPAFLDDRSNELAWDYDRIFTVNNAAADGSESIDIIPQPA